MRLQVFDVEHGACSLLTADNGTRLMVDCGHNATTQWKPGTHLRQQNIYTLNMLAITNYDEDHTSAAANLFENIDVQWLLRNPSVSGSTIMSLKSEDGMGPGIETLVYQINNVFTGEGTSSPEPVFNGVERQIFYNNYPKFDDENNLSLVLFLKCHGIGVMFPGDLEKSGFIELLKYDYFKQALRETNVYFASHHGRENGCCEEIVQYLQNAYYVVISDKGYAHETQETVPFYRRIAKGGPFRNQEKRHVLTTRNDGSITFDFSPQGWGPW
jgi:beta-lactamase superfamily II metal-dependent hydrolase